MYHGNSFNNIRMDMKNEEIKNAAYKLFERVDSLNRKARYKKFHTFSTFKENRLFEYGVYNYESKKYVLFFAHSLDPRSDLTELEKFLR